MAQIIITVVELVWLIRNRHVLISLAFWRRIIISTNPSPITLAEWLYGPKCEPTALGRLLESKSGKALVLLISYTTLMCVWNKFLSPTPLF